MGVMSAHRVCFICQLGGTRNSKTVYTYPYNNNLEVPSAGDFGIVLKSRFCLISPSVPNVPISYAVASGLDPFSRYPLNGDRRASDGPSAQSFFGLYMMPIQIAVGRRPMTGS